jgi:hypothetical protein
MELEAIRILADWLADATRGVNALLPAVPRDIGDAQPALVTIVDETRTDWVARRDVPSDVIDAGSVIAISIADLGDFQPVIPSVYRNAHIPVLFRYLCKNAKTADGVRDGLYTKRAIARSLKLLMDNDSAAERYRNAIRLEGLTDWKVIPAAAFDGTAPIATGFFVTCFMTDDAP